MPAVAGNLNVDGRNLDITQADCTLFVGRIDIEFATSEFNGSFNNIPVGDAVNFGDLSDKSFSLTNCRSAIYDNPLFKPTLYLQHEYSPIDRIAIDAIEIAEGKIAFTLDGIAQFDENESQMSFRSTLAAECVKFDRFWLLHRPEPIPIRFASHYLPMVGAHAFQSVTTREDVIGLMGKPDDVGGGDHPKFGTIPQWIRYTFSDYFLRFQLDSDIVTFITIMNRDSMLQFNADRDITIR